MSDYEEARKQWISERPAFEEFGVLVKGKLVLALKQ